MRRAGRCSAPLRRSGFVCCPSADYRNLEQLFSPSPRGDTDQLEAAFWGDYNTPRGRSGGKKKLKSKGLNDLERQRSRQPFSTHAALSSAGRPRLGAAERTGLPAFIIIIILIGTLFFSLYQLAYVHSSSPSRFLPFTSRQTELPDSARGRQTSRCEGCGAAGRSAAGDGAGRARSSPCRPPRGRERMRRFLNERTAN